MVRYPVAGKAKTRLAEEMGVQKALEFYEQCASHILQEMAHLPSRITKYVFYTGATSSRIKDWVGTGYELRAQTSGDLGGRLADAFTQMFTDGMERAVIMASDVPDITSSLMATSVEALESADVVIGPSHDGGYYLIGMSALQVGVFDGIRWGSSHVLRQTMARVDKSGMASRLLPTLIDIDTTDDYDLWCSASEKDFGNVLNRPHS
jgi:uncharacterized protein